MEGGEDEGTVRFLLGFNGEEASAGVLLGGVETFVGMDNVEKYVGEGIMNMSLPSPALQEYLHPPGRI